MNTIHSVSNTSLVRSSEAVAVRKSFSFRTFMMRVMLVIAIVVGGKVAWGETVTYTITSTSAVSTTGTAPAGSSASFINTYTSNKNQLTSGKSMTLTLSGYAGCKITGITLSMKSNKSSGAGNFSMVAGTTTLSSISSNAAFNTSSWYDNWSTSYVNVTPTMSNSNYVIQSGQNVVITIAATANSLYCQSFTITYGYASTTPIYTLSADVYPASSGAVTLSSTSVEEGSTATATANPNAGYAFDHWSISGTGASLSSTSTNPTTVTMGTANATVTAHFTEVLHRVEFDYGTGKCSTFPAITELTESSPNSGVVLPSALPHSWCTEYEFLGWATSAATGTSESPNIVGVVGDTYHPSGDITLYAVYVSYSGNYTKVDEDYLTNWSGKYLIVYEAGNKAFDGSLETLDATNNYIDVEITSSTIVSDATTDARSFTIVQSGENCTIKSNSGYYIGQTRDANGLSQSTTAYTNNISYYESGESIDIRSSGGAYLRFNSASNQLRFRYFKSGTFTAQQPIQLYRKTATFNTNPDCPEPSSLTITYEPNGTSVTGSVTDDNTYGYNDPVTVLDGDGFVNEGYTFAGWNTAANGYGDDYGVGDVFNITENITLYAQWTPNEYTVNWYANGSVVESLPIHHGNSFLDEGYDSDGIAYIDDDADGNACDDMHIVGWYESEFEEFDGTPTLLQYDDIARAIATGNKNYYAVFANVSETAVRWNLVTDEDNLVAGDSVIIVASDYACAMSKTQNGNNRGQTSITKSGSEISLNSYVCVFEIQNGLADGTLAFYDANYNEGNGGYLYAASSSNNYLRTEEELDINGNGNWTISIDEGTGVATITAQGSNSRNLLRYNNSNSIFSCYGSGQNDVSIYKKTGGTTYSNHTTFCPCAYDIDGISNGDMVWAGKNGPTNEWNYKSNWVVYNSSDSKYHLAANVPTESSNVFIINKRTECNINVKPLLTSNITCNNITMSSNMGINLDEYNLTVTGDLTNDGSEITGTGKIIFAGTAAQTISGATTFGNVEFNNSNGITTSTEPTINGTATFTNGVINGNVTFGSGARVSGASANSHVDGVVTKSGAANGFTFPTGSNGNLGKVEVTDGSATNVSVQYFSNPAGFGTNDLPRWWNAADMSGENPFNHVSNVEYWKISSNEAITADFVAEASTDMHFNSETDEEDRIPANIQMAFYDNNRWTNVGGLASISDNTLKITGAEIPASATRGISGNYTTFGSKSKSTVLPIELVSFTANCNGRSALIEWTTATEKNNDFFVLERSNDAVNFKEIARIAGAGNSIEPISYAYTDFGVRNGDNYYRLVQVDYDGTSTASEIIVANCLGTDGEPEVLAYPNPFGDDLTLRFENFGNIQATVEVYDMLGRMVHTQKVNCSQNDYEVVLRLAGLSDGTYNVRISAKDFVVNRQVIKN